MKHDSHIPRRTVEDQLQRVLVSKAFVQSARMSRFLRFTVEHALNGTPDQLKEYVLGVEVFDRRASYDPRVDPIVRVEARRLRSKLKSYYEGEGIADPLIIELPTGAYVPHFRTSGSAAIQEPAPQAGSSARSIAVLPFSNLSAEPDTEYFSDGLTEELIHGLTKLDGLRVVAWTSAARLKSHAYDVREIGQQLKVSTILMGSVRGSSERLRIMAQLVDASGGQYLWSETYDRRMEDLFAIQEEISAAIVKTLRLKLIDHQVALSPRKSAHNLEAYNLFLKSRYHLNKRTSEGLQRALEYAQQATTVDPMFAPGYAGVADSYILLTEYGFMSPESSIPRARTAARKALEIDPELGDAHASLGLICSIYDWEWADAERHYRRAIQLNPGYASAHHWFSVDFLGLMGRWDEAFEEIEIALQLDPLSAIIREGRGYLLMMRGRYAEAIEEYRAILEFDKFFYKAFTSMGRAFTQMGRYDDAIGMLLKGRLLSGDVGFILGCLGQTYALAGRTDEARAALDELARIARGRYVPATCFAVVHMGLGENDRALDWLEDGARHRETALAAIKVHPVYNPLRSEPRFKALLGTLGFAPKAVSGMN